MSNKINFGESKNFEASARQWLDAGGKACDASHSKENAPRNCQDWFHAAPASPLQNNFLSALKTPTTKKTRGSSQLLKLDDRKNSNKCRNSKGETHAVEYVRNDYQGKNEFRPRQANPSRGMNHKLIIFNPKRGYPGCYINVEHEKQEANSGQKFSGDYRETGENWENCSAERTCLHQILNFISEVVVVIDQQRSHGTMVHEHIRVENFTNQFTSDIKTLLSPDYLQDLSQLMKTCFIDFNYDIESKSFFFLNSETQTLNGLRNLLLRLRNVVTSYIRASEESEKFPSHETVWNEGQNYHVNSVKPNLFGPSYIGLGSAASTDVPNSRALSNLSSSSSVKSLGPGEAAEKTMKMEKSLLMPPKHFSFLKRNTVPIGLQSVPTSVMKNKNTNAPPVLSSRSAKLATTLTHVSEKTPQPYLEVDNKVGTKVSLTPKNISPESDVTVSRISSTSLSDTSSVHDTDTPLAKALSGISAATKNEKNSGSSDVAERSLSSSPNTRKNAWKPMSRFGIQGQDRESRPENEDAPVDEKKRNPNDFDYNYANQYQLKHTSSHSNFGNPSNNFFSLNISELPTDDTNYLYSEKYANHSSSPAQAPDPYVLKGTLDQIGAEYSCLFQQSFNQIAKHLKQNREEGQEDKLYVICWYIQEQWARRIFGKRKDGSLTVQQKIEVGTKAKLLMYPTSFANSAYSMNLPLRNENGKNYGFDINLFSTMNAPLNKMYANQVPQSNISELAMRYFTIIGATDAIVKHGAEELKKYVYRPLRLEPRAMWVALQRRALCLNCDGTDHHYQNCPLNDVMVCFNCHKPHTLSDCKELCRVCGQMHPWNSKGNNDGSDAWSPQKCVRRWGAQLPWD